MLTAEKDNPMTKKEYAKFAKMLKETKQECTKAYEGYELITACEVLTVIEEKMIVIFREDNPNFDYARFEQATEIK